MVAHEPHVAATSLQREHVQQAAVTPALFARNNGGRPAVAATPRPAAFTAPGAVGAHGTAVPPPHAVARDNRPAYGQPAGQANGRTPQAPAYGKQQSSAGFAGKEPPASFGGKQPPPAYGNAPQQANRQPPAQTHGQAPAPKANAPKPHPENGKQENGKHQGETAER